MRPTEGPACSIASPVCAGAVSGPPAAAAEPRVQDAALVSVRAHVLQDAAHSAGASDHERRQAGPRAGARGPQHGSAGLLRGPHAERAHEGAARHPLQVRVRARAARAVRLRAVRVLRLRAVRVLCACVCACVCACCARACLLTAGRVFVPQQTIGAGGSRPAHRRVRQGGGARECVQPSDAGRGEGARRGAHVLALRFAAVLMGARAGRRCSSGCA